LSFLLAALCGVVGFVLGLHTAIRFDLGEPMEHLKRHLAQHRQARAERRQVRKRDEQATMDWPVILPRRRALVFMVAVTAMMLVATLAASLSWGRAQESADQSAEAQERARAASVRAERAVAELGAFVECYAEYQTQFVEIYEPRSNAAADVAEAIEDVFRLLGPVRAPDAEAQFERVRQEYLRLRQEFKREQRENPLPPPPTRVCGSTAQGVRGDLITNGRAS
jgi:hypothetical protein